VGDLLVNKRTYIVLAIILTGASVLFFDSFYEEAKNTAITKLNEEQSIHAKQAARGIEDFFATWMRSLNSLSKMDAIIDNDAVGKRALKNFYDANQEQIRSITRLDERGVILYNFPSIRAVGADISGQNHVRELLRDHKPVISDVFKAVEGFDSIALHVPIFKGPVFKGSIGILIDFESLAKRYLDVIKIGKTGYAWVVSREGTILYTPVPGLTGKSVFEIITESSSLDLLVSEMVKGHEGAATYTFDKIGDRNVGQTRKYAVYIPAQIGNTFWSIVVASAEQDVLSGLISLRNKLALVIGVLFICGMVFSTLGAKASLIVKEEEQRKQTEKQLRESEERLRDITFNMADWVWEVDEKGVYTYSSVKGNELFGRVIGKTPFDLMPPDEAKRVAAIFSEIAANKAPIKDLENWNIGKAGERICLLTNGVPLLDEAGNLKGYRGVDKDITERKLAEAARRESMERYKAVVEAFDGLIYSCSADHRVEFMNQRLIERTGRNAVGETCYKALHDRDSVCEWCVNERVFEGETVRWEVQSPKDSRWYYVVNTPIRHADGTMSKQSMIMDITERKQAEEALKANETALRNSKKDLQRLAGRLISAQEEELRRLSRELHDDLTQRLAVLAIEAGKLELDLNKMPEKYPEIVHTVTQIKDQLIKVSEDVHTISRQLHPTILDDLGLVRAIESECTAFMRRNPVEITFRKENVPDAIPDDIALCLYRVVQEGMKNIATHSGAKNCEILLKGDDHTVCLSVADKGIGFDPLAVRNMPGLGLSSMRERVQLVQGEFTIRSQPGKGTVINVCVPCTGSDT
jgi:PAS domain S-box-containing protein